MLFHTMVGSNDIERSKRFYDTLLGTLGIGEAILNMADSGHTRLIYRGEDGTTFMSVNRSMTSRLLFQTAARSPSSAAPRSKCSNSMTLLSRLEGHRLKLRLAPVTRHPWAPSSLPMFATRTATSFVAFTVPDE